MEKNLILGFIGKNSKGIHRLSNEAITQLIRENYPLGYATVLTGIDGSFEMSCANTVIRLRSDGLDIRLIVAVAQRKFESFTRYVRDGRPLNDGQLIISQADDLQIIGGGSSLAADVQRDKYIIDSSDLLYFYAPAGRESYRGKYISYYLSQLPHKNSCNLSEKSARAFVAREASLRYIRLHDLVIMSNDIDKVYLQDWLAPDSGQLKKYFKNPEATAAQLLRETGVCDPKLLPLRVFFYAFANSLLVRITRPEMYWPNSRAYFEDFQHILRIIRLARAHNIEIPDFNIFDFTRYGEIMRRIFQYQELK